MSNDVTDISIMLTPYGERFVSIELPIEVGETEIILSGRVMLLDHNGSTRRRYSSRPVYYGEVVWGREDSADYQALCWDLIRALDLQHKIDDTVYDIVMAAREYEADLQDGYAEEKGQY